MKSILKWLAIAAALTLWLAPLAAALLDTGCWFFVNHQCTAIVWGGMRQVLVLLWTVAPLLAVCV